MIPSTLSVSRGSHPTMPNSLNIWRPAHQNFDWFPASKIKWHSLFANFNVMQFYLFQRNSIFSLGCVFAPAPSTGPVPKLPPWRSHLMLGQLYTFCTACPGGAQEPRLCSHWVAGHWIPTPFYIRGNIRRIFLWGWGILICIRSVDFACALSRWYCGKQVEGK